MPLLELLLLPLDAIAYLLYSIGISPHQFEGGLNPQAKLGIGAQNGQYPAYGESAAPHLGQIHPFIPVGQTFIFNISVLHSEQMFSLFVVDPNHSPQIEQ